MSTRARRAPHSRTVVRLPEQPVHERVLELAAPLLDHLGPQPSPEKTREALELAVEFWNAKVDLLLEPRLVAAWSFERSCTAATHRSHTALRSTVMTTSRSTRPWPRLRPLLAEGTLPPVGARSVELRVGGKPFEAMDFRELRLSSSGLGDAQAVILFEPSSTTGQTS